MRVCGDYGLRLTQNLSVGELAKHHHSIYYDSSYEAYPHAGTGVWKQGLININGPYGINNNVGEYTGDNQYHNNIASCVAVYLWHRTA